MTPGRTGRPDQDGDYQLRMLEDVWNNTLRHWHDDMARDFAARYWAPLCEESRSYLEALRKLTEMLGAAEYDTDY